MRIALAAAACVLAAASASAQLALIQTLDREGVSRVVISDAGIFEVTIKGTSGTVVQVEVRSADAADTVRESVSGDELTIAAGRKDRVRSIGSKPPQLSLRVPGSTTLTVETGSGNVTIETVNGAKRVVTSSGNLILRSSDGAIDARSTTGNQKYDYVKGDVRAQSTTGNIEMANVEGRTELESKTGQLWGRAVRITGDSRFRTSTGRIEMAFANPIEDFTFSLQSFTGRIEVAGTQGRGKLQKGEGPLRITGQTSTGRQSYK